MKSTIIAGTIVLASVSNVTSALAQTTPPGANQADADNVRYRIATMEGILEKAVQQGARVLNQRFQAIGPSMMILGGRVGVRGFRLENYGIFFDVEVPGVSESITYLLQNEPGYRFLTQDQNRPGVSNAFQTIQQFVAQLDDASTKRKLEDALKRLESQVTPVSLGGAAAAERVLSGAQAVNPAQAGQAPRQAEAARLLQNPREAYRADVKNALIDAVLDHAHTLEVGPDEWVTIAARGSAEPLGGMADLSDRPTLTVRIKGVDLMALRSGRLTKEEARNKVEVREF